MRIGIVTDIHDEAEKLAAALTRLRAERVDVIVSLGDTSDLYSKWEQVSAIAASLKAFGAVGVWGNHDYGLCTEVSETTRDRFSPDTLDYMATMKPRLELGGCHFTHVEPWLDTEKIEDLWWVEGPPEDAPRLATNFAAVPHRALFIGHYHQWLAFSDSGPVAWDGLTPLTFEPDRRYLVVIGPLFRGDFAIMDTDRWILEPLHLPPEELAP